MKRILLCFFLAITLVLCSCGDNTPANENSELQSGEVSNKETSEQNSDELSNSENESGTEPETALNHDEIVILYTNDVHCGVNDGIGYKGLSLIKNSFEAQGKAVILVDGGDSVQGDTIGTVSKGEYIIELMNEVGYDVAIPGNHEFDYGMEQFFSLVEMADFPYLSCNFTNPEGKLALEPYRIIEAGGAKIAFVGISTPKTLSSCSPTFFQDENGNYIYGFCQDSTGEALYNAVQDAVDSAKADGADYVIALGHLGIEAECKPWMSTDVINNTTGIDVFIDAHSHSVLENVIVKNKEGADVVHTSTGTKLANVGCLSIGTDGSFKTTLINDGGIESFITEIEDSFAELVNTVVASSNVDLVIYDPFETDSDGNPIRLIRITETNLGNLCADAYRSISGADIAMVNGGGIRAELKKGDVTYGDIISVHPFGNELCVVEATGQMLLDALELGSASLPGEDGSFQHVSGLTYEIDLNVESSVKLDDKGQFINVDGDYRVKNIKVGGEPLDLNKTYVLAGHNYMLKEFGGGFNMFKDAKMIQDCVMLDYQVVINYITDVLGGVIGEEYAEPYGEGRITIIEAE